MNDKFTKNDEMFATSKGWELSSVYDTRGYWALSIFPCNRSSFKSPNDAKTFVWGEAKKGCGVSLRALRLVTSSELAAQTSKKRKPKK